MESISYDRKISSDTSISCVLDAHTTLLPRKAYLLIDSSGEVSN